jgi:hypothetical protein
VTYIAFALAFPAVGSIPLPVIAMSYANQDSSYEVAGVRESSESSRDSAHPLSSPSALVSQSLIQDYSREQNRLSGDAERQEKCYRNAWDNITHRSGPASISSKYSLRGDDVYQLWTPEDPDPCTMNWVYMGKIGIQYGKSPLWGWVNAYIFTVEGRVLCVLQSSEGKITKSCNDPVK